MLASVDGAIGPAEQATIPVSDDGLLRGDGAFEVMRLYSGTPFALDEHFARLGRSCAGLRLDADLDDAAPGGRRAARAGGTGRGPAAAGRDPRRPPDRDRRAAPAPRADRAGDDRPLRAQSRPRRPQDALLRRQHARAPPGHRAGLRRGAAGDAPRPRAGRPDVVVLLGPRRTAAHAAARGPDPGLDHPRAHPRRDRRARGAVARSTTSRSADEAFIASTVREVLPIAAIDDLTLPAAPGPVTLAAREALGQAIRAEL